MSKKRILTGDRPTGKLHLGHYTGSLRNRVALQNTGEYDMYIMIADQQALTDNAKDPQKIINSVMETDSAREDVVFYYNESQRFGTFAVICRNPLRSPSAIETE